MKYAAILITLAFAILAVAILAVDWAIGTYAKWHKRRALHIRAKDLARFNIGAFRGARKFDDPRWPS